MVSLTMETPSRLLVGHHHFWWRRRCGEWVVPDDEDRDGERHDSSKRERNSLILARAPPWTAAEVEGFDGGQSYELWIESFSPLRRKYLFFLIF
ncbi:hypothetical protein Hdeb2414_s0025g00662951 [Helianthus debilis subsp. tardiflorus]